MTVGVYTLGCKVNTYESEYIIKLLKENNYEIKDFNDICDIYIINTCTVTNTSDIKSRKIIRQAVKRNPSSIVIALGCFIEANKDYKDEGVDIVIGTKDKSRIIEILDEYINNPQFLNKTTALEKTTFEDMFIKEFEGRTRAFVKIQDGCENLCSYCIIPLVRGKCRSKAFDKVLEEVKILVDNGYQEIVLTGIHTGNYGKDIGTNFENLLKEIVKIEGLKRLRISSIEITELTDGVLDIIKNNEKIANHLHIPLQAGSDKILSLMNRKYDLNYFFKKVEDIRKIRKDIALTTDVIVGFPMEEEKDFLDTINTVKKLKFAKIHVFPYSKRNNTKASTMDGQVESTTKKERARRLLQVSHQLEEEYMKKFLGHKVSVLTEQTKDGTTYGHTSNYLPVKINKQLKSNIFVDVNLKEISYPYVVGDVNE